MFTKALDVTKGGLMISQKLSELARKISALEERDLIYVLSRVLPEFSPYESHPVTDLSGFFLGAFRCQRGTVEIDIVAYPDLDEYGDDPGPDWGLCQRTPSEVKGLEYVSNVKNCLSPFDGRRLHLT